MPVIVEGMARDEGEPIVFPSDDEWKTFQQQKTTDETVVLLSRQKIDGYIDIDLDVEKLESKNGTATYPEIKAFVEEKYGFKIHTAYIAQMKDKAGLEKRKNYYIGSGKSREMVCPPEKEEAIMDAFRHFHLI